MSNIKPYIEQVGKVIESNGRFEHVMALTLNPMKGNEEGLVRCIVNREGEVGTYGYVDKSQIFKIHGESLEHFVVTNRLEMKNEHEILERVIVHMNQEEGVWEYLGHEDPDIWNDDKTGLVHVYFTMPFLERESRRMLINLGHAVGKNLDSLEMTMPVLLHASGASREKGVLDVAKELSIAPMNTKEFRYNLIESADIRDGIWYSTVRVVIARDMGSGWEMGDVVFHPLEEEVFWAGEHASPGPLFPESFINLGKGRVLGILNGREVSDRTGATILYRDFSPGLFIYNYEEGKIEWVSPVPLLRDSEAKTITFASDFVETKEGFGILYAHVDDSFVRAYTLSADGIRALIPERFQM